MAANYKANPFTLTYDGAIRENVKGQVNLHTVHYPAKGIEAAANVYTPANFDPAKSYPAIVVAHPNGGVKEQVAGLYAQKLAEAGYVTIAFDAAYQSASGGKPRYIDKPQFRIEDIRAAADYMDLIDQDWLRIADWYRPGTTPQHRLDHRELWQEGEGSLMIAQLQRTNIKTPSQYTFKECPSSFISSCVTLTQITQRRAGNYARAQRYRHRRLSYVTSRQIFLLRRKESLYLVSSSSHGAS